MLPSKMLQRPVVSLHSSGMTFSSVSLYESVEEGEEEEGYLKPFFSKEKGKGRSTTDVRKMRRLFGGLYTLLWRAPYTLAAFFAAFSIDKKATHMPLGKNAAAAAAIPSKYSPFWIQMPYIFYIS